MQPAEGSGIWRLSVVVAVGMAAVLASAQIVRSAAVADRGARPGLAGDLWPSHPAVLTDRALLEIAKAAARGRPVPQQVRADDRRVAASAPLSADPYLIEAAIAQSEGRAGMEPLLLAARSRNPRSKGTRYLLAEHYLRSGRIEAGLTEMSALVAIHGGGEVFVPALAAYARTPGALPFLKSFFARKPVVEPAVLTVLAGDPANADLILSLASNLRDPEPDWRPVLVSAIASSGQHEKAYAVWTNIYGLGATRALFNPAFAVLPASPPFNWRFEESSEGVAEPDGKGGLSILYYGRAHALLASQLLLLPAGAHRLSMTVNRESGQDTALRWTVRCASSERAFLQLPLATGRLDAALVVPVDCPAQWLELAGVAGDVPETSTVTISGLRLERGANR